MLRFPSSFLILLIGSIALPAEAGKLDRTRNQTTGGGKSKSDRDVHDDDDDDDDDGILAGILCAFFCSDDEDSGSNNSSKSASSSASASPRPPGERHQYFFLPHPYFRGSTDYAIALATPASTAHDRAEFTDEEGKLVLPDGLQVEGYGPGNSLYIRGPTELRTLGYDPHAVPAKELDNRGSGQGLIALDYSKVLPDLNRFAGSLQLSAGWIGLDGGVQYFQEGNDYLYITHVGAFFQGASARGLFQVGAAGLHFGGRGESDDDVADPDNEGPEKYSEPGWAVHLGGHFLPFRPLILSPSLRVGMIGAADALYARARLTAGALVGPIELFGGWDHTQVGGESLSGPVGGLRLWF